VLLFFRHEPELVRAELTEKCVVYCYIHYGWCVTHDAGLYYYVMLSKKKDHQKHVFFSKTT